MTALCSDSAVGLAVSENRHDNVGLLLVSFKAKQVIVFFQKKAVCSNLLLGLAVHGLCSKK